MSLQIINAKSVCVKMEKVAKLSMCRICLVENVRMYVVTDNSVREMFEKLADIPFVTEDSRPMLACYFCYAELKQCCRLKRKCVQAEELFAKMLNEDYKLDPTEYRSQFNLFSGFVKTPMESISMVDDSQVDSHVIKEELPFVCDRQDITELIQLKVEPLSDELELDEQDYSYPNLEDNPALHSVSDSNDDSPLITMKFEEEEVEVSDKKKTICAKKPEPDIREAKQEDIIPVQHENNRLPDWKITLATKNRRSNAKIKEPIAIMNPRVNKCIVEDSTETFNN